MTTNTVTLMQAKKKKGAFTLIEVIAVLVLLGILAAVAIPKYIDMAASARQRAIDGGISEMNGREALTWGNAVMATGGWAADVLPTDTNLNKPGATDYVWTTGPNLSGTSDLTFQTNTTVSLTRVPSTATSPAVWHR